MKTYPIKFEPILKEKPWGGSKLHTVLHKKACDQPIGESWEISGLRGSETMVNNGTYRNRTLSSLLSQFGQELVGEKNYKRFGNEFPLLIKFLHAATNLSVQVHPDDTMAKALHNAKGKTEMWYVVDHEDNAEIIVGLDKQVSSTTVLQDINRQNVYDVFNVERVSKGDVYYIPAGEVHAIGAGVLAAEIQQTSDITYRVYDWDREDAQGQKRELHIQQSIAATKPPTKSNKVTYNTTANAYTEVVSCPYFTTNVLTVNTTLERQYKPLDSFVVLMCVEGSAIITVNGHQEKIEMGTSILLPAQTSQAQFTSSKAKFLEVYIN